MTAEKRAVPAQEQVDAVSPRAISIAWDPYEVWLKRVKQPREHDVTAVPKSAVVSADTRVVRHVWLRLKPNG
jgi:hypothetical protein